MVFQQATSAGLALSLKLWTTLPAQTWQAETQHPYCLPTIKHDGWSLAAKSPRMHACQLPRPSAPVLHCCTYRSSCSSTFVWLADDTANLGRREICGVEVIGPTQGDGRQPGDRRRSENWVEGRSCSKTCLAVGAPQSHSDGRSSQLRLGILKRIESCNGLDYGLWSIGRAEEKQECR